MLGGRNIEVVGNTFVNNTLAGLLIDDQSTVKTQGNIFTTRWLARAERDTQSYIDDGDRFLALWISFNSRSILL